MKNIQKTIMRSLGTAGLTGLVGVTAWADTPSPPPPPPPPPGIADACKADLEALCPGVTPGGGRIAACLKANRRALSPECKEAIRERRREHAEVPGTPPPSPPPPPPSSPPPST